MNFFSEISDNKVLWTAVLAWFAAQLLKVVLIFITKRKIDFSRIVGSGGMPSSHSAFTVALATSVGMLNGFQTVEFAVCSCIALVVMYDAAGVRRSAGEQAKILNKIVEQWGKEDFTETEKKLKELLGHTPVEVVAGAVLGAVIGVLCFL